jgi:Fe-S-cluster containining protein
MTQPSSPENHSLPGCLACGTCCFSQLVNYVRVSGDDYGRLGDLAADRVVFDGNQAFMRMVDGHCAALTSAPGHFSCDVYLDRPDTCRGLERGSGACAGERDAKGERPAAHLVTLTARSGPNAAARAQRP